MEPPVTDANVNKSLVDELYQLVDSIHAHPNTFVSMSVYQDLEITKNKMRRLLSEIRGV